MLGNKVTQVFKFRAKNWVVKLHVECIRAKTCRITQTGVAKKTCLIKCIYWY